MIGFPAKKIYLEYTWRPVPGWIQYRIIKISLFEKRWWDYNDVKDIETGKIISKKDEQLFFVVTPAEVSFPEKLQMQSFY